MLTLTLPNLLAIEDATSTEAAEMKIVTENMDPRVPDGKSNLVLKKSTIQALKHVS